MTEQELISKLLHLLHQERKEVVVATTRGGIRFGLCRMGENAHAGAPTWFHVCHSDDQYPLSEIVDIEIQEK